MKSSRLKGFYKLPVQERLEKVARWAELDEEEKEILYSHRGFHVDHADKMIENVAGLFPLPFGVGANFRINGKDYLIPMVIEEASVVAAASNAARYMRSGDGIESTYTSSLSIGQIQLLDVPDMEEARRAIDKHREELLDMGNDPQSLIVRKGGGLKEIEIRSFSEEKPYFMVIHLHIDVLDAMGANAINTICERLAPRIEEITGARAGLKILSNLSDSRLVRCRVRIPLGKLHKDSHQAHLIARGIEEASIFAERDSYRAVTHNKGIMNGIDSVLLATGQDWRAVEAGAHAYASKDGHYTALARWRYAPKKRYLEGEMELPISVGAVGGITNVHPTVKLGLKILGVKTGRELSEIVAAVGLAQNFAAIKALSTEGIQRGHMSLHSRNIAVSVGAKGKEIDLVARQLIEEGNVQSHKAKEILYDLRKEKSRDLAASVGAEEDEIAEVSHQIFIKKAFQVGKAKQILQEVRRGKNGHGKWKSREQNYSKR